MQYEADFRELTSAFGAQEDRADDDVHSIRCEAICTEAAAAALDREERLEAKIGT